MESGSVFSGNNPFPCSKHETEWGSLSLATPPLATTPSLAPNARWRGFSFSGDNPSLASNARWRGFSFSGDNPLLCSKCEMEWVPFSLATTPSLAPNARWSQFLFPLATTPSITPNMRWSGVLFLLQHPLWQQPPPSLQMQDGGGSLSLATTPPPSPQTRDGVGFRFLW